MSRKPITVGTLLDAKRCRRAALAWLALFVVVGGVDARSAPAAEKPKVRAVTAFVRLERADYQVQIEEALRMLRQATAAYEQAGFEVQSIRISTQPFADYAGGVSRAEALAFFREYDELARKEGFDAAIGPAMVAEGDSSQAELLAEILANNTALSGSLIVAGAGGVNWNAVRAAAKVIKYLTEHSPGGIANFNFAATALVPHYTPFYPASYHTGGGHAFAVALQSANVVAAAFAAAKSPEEARTLLEHTLGEHARNIENIALRLEQETRWSYIGIDLSPAPLKEVSIGRAVETLLGAKFGSSGTMTAAAAITSALQAIPVKHAGYSGLMLPVLEDQVLAERWSEGTLTLDALLAYSAVCGTGLDTIPLPGDVSEQHLVRIIGDMASIAVKLRKPLSARLMPVAGKKPSERTEFQDPFIVNATIQPLR